MSKFFNMMVMTPPIIAGMALCELTVGAAMDQFAFAAISVDSSRPAWSTAMLDMFPQIHFFTFIIGVAWIIGCVLALISDAAYTRGEVR